MTSAPQQSVFDYHTARVGVAIFPLGAGAFNFQYGELGRQIAEELSVAFSSCPRVISIPQMLTYPETGSERSDNRIRFIINTGASELGVYRQAALELGCRLAVTGRLLFDGFEVTAVCNLWDVRRNLLLCPGLYEGEQDNIPTMVSQMAKRLMGSLQISAPEVESGLSFLPSEISFKAFLNWSKARDILRRVSSRRGLTPLRERLQALAQLGYALREAPDFQRARLLFCELFVHTLDTPEAFWELREAIVGIPRVVVTFGLLEAEVLKRLGERAAAANVLEETVAAFPKDERAYMALQELLRDLT